MNGVQRTFADQGLVRPRSGRIVGGVSAGLARRFGLDPWLVRLIFIILVLFAGTSIVIYPILWFLMPSD
jgi:phage shock protein PspC (stress-responsive transcriptional regulator)